MVTVGLLVTLQARPGKEEELAGFLASALPLAQAEPETTAWFAIKIDDSTFGIADFFPAAAGRQAHLDGPISAALPPTQLRPAGPAPERYQQLADAVDAHCADYDLFSHATPIRRTIAVTT